MIVLDGLPFSNFAQLDLEYNDRVTIPPSHPGDILQVNASYAVYQGYMGTSGGEKITIGSNNSPSTNISLETGDYFNCRYHYCTYSDTLNAAGYDYLQFMGAASISITPGDNSLVDVQLYSEVTLALFKPDGITPDLFTPEPNSVWLSLIGISSLAGWAIRRRAK